MDEYTNTTIDHPHLPVNVHIACMLFIILVGGCGNGLVIYFYFKRDSQTIKNCLVFFLAVLDFGACIFLCPMLTVLECFAHRENVWPAIILTNNIMIMHDFFLLGNIDILCLMAIGRCWAVLRPYSYNSFQRNIKTIVLIILTLTAIEIIFCNVMRMGLLHAIKLQKAVLATHIIIGFVTLIMTYPIAFVQSYKQKYRMLQKQGKILANQRTNKTSCQNTHDQTIEAPIKPQLSSNHTLYKCNKSSCKESGATNRIHPDCNTAVKRCNIEGVVKPSTSNIFNVKCNSFTTKLESSSVKTEEYIYNKTNGTSRDLVILTNTKQCGNDTKMNDAKHIITDKLHTDDIKTIERKLGEGKTTNKHVIKNIDDAGRQILFQPLNQK